jgi:hypothetical protein
VRDCKYLNQITLNRIRDVKGKHLQINPSVVAPFPWNQGIQRDPSDMAHRLLIKSFAQTESK